MMKSSYAILFRVELVHEYFSNRQCPDFEIVPSADTVALLKRAKVIWRNTGNKLTAFIEQNEAGEPLLNRPTAKYYRQDFGARVFRFYLKLKNPLFFNYTNFNLDLNRRQKFYFSNLAANGGPGYLFLSAPVPAFTLGKQYLPGDIARDPGTGNVYEALKKYTSKKKAELTDPVSWSPKGLLQPNNGPAEFTPGRSYNPGELVTDTKTGNIFESISRYTTNSVAELNDPTLWLPRGTGQLAYVGENDLVDYSSGNYPFIAPGPLTKADITILGFNYDAASPAYDVVVKETETKNFPQPVSVIPVSLSSLKAGKYLVKVNNESRLVYYDPALSTGDVFGVVEIFNFLPGDNNYSLLTADEKIKATTYHISFAARSVLWKYIRKDGKAQSVTDTGATHYQFNLKGDGFVSSSPIPLTENVLKTLTLEFNTTDFKLSPLPNPSPERFSKCHQNDYDYLCSEVYLNY
jgi:hypothetical protein